MKVADTFPHSFKIRVGVTLKCNLSSNLFDLIWEPMIQKLMQLANTRIKIVRTTDIFLQRNNYMGYSYSLVANTVKLATKLRGN